MARIAAELLTLLLDNAQAQPVLDGSRRQRLFGAAVLLDLAYLCRIRPSEPGDPAPPDRLLVLMGPDPADTVLSPALRLLAHKPISAAAAISQIGGHAERRLFEQLVRTGELQPIRLVHPTRWWPGHAWTLTDRARPARARAAILAALTADQPPGPPAAAIISLLYSVNGLDALFSFDALGWQRVNDRAGEIASGSWANRPFAQIAEINLAVTTAVVRHALSTL
jgi:hypothetical protein